MPVIQKSSDVKDFLRRTLGFSQLNLEKHLLDSGIEEIRFGFDEGVLVVDVLLHVFISLFGVLHLSASGPSGVGSAVRIPSLFPGLFCLIILLDQWSGHSKEQVSSFELITDDLLSSFQIRGQLGSILCNFSQRISFFFLGNCFLNKRLDLCPLGVIGSFLFQHTFIVVTVMVSCKLQFSLLVLDPSISWSWSLGGSSFSSVPNIFSLRI